ncbi:hypothetical protein JOF36_002493 [Pseudonocardia parietis]|uniref:DUF4202 domain-containing protein n=2 Tax=Pseudonocardia parietis TaxID=570936 RepID=A0ABS4VS78_9PSEU|nr:hypothetical protein [Pseudonocardia parietis]
MSTSMPWTAPRVEAHGEVEALATEWIAAYDQAEHLVRARDWLVHLASAATAEMRIAALTHDIERMFPGGPVLRHADGRWDDPDYLFPHMLRSAEVVTVWLGNLGPVAATVDRAEIRRLVGLHEVGGIDGADEVQAADSLSFLETLAGLTRDWVRSGVCSRSQAERKLRYMTDRVRTPAAAQYAAPLLAWALDQLPTESETEVPQR